MCIRDRFRESARRGQHDKDKDGERVLVFAPAAVLSYFRYCLEVAGLEDLVTLMDITVTCFAGDPVHANKASLGVVKSVVSVPVLHCKHAYGVVLSLRVPALDGIGEGQTLKVVYSGDCRPSKALAAAGRGCDLLIHEATFADSRSADAKRKLHCTRSEAMRVSGTVSYTHLTLPTILLV